MEYGDAVTMARQQKRLLTKYGNIPLLIIDEWLVTDISESELYFLFELMERRSDATSIIFCTQYRKEDCGLSGYGMRAGESHRWPVCPHCLLDRNRQYVYAGILCKVKK